MSGKRAADSQKGVDTFSGSIKTFKPPRWNTGIRRSFEKGDLRQSFGIRLQHQRRIGEGILAL